MIYADPFHWNMPHFHYFRVLFYFFFQLPGAIFICNHNYFIVQRSTRSACTLETSETCSLSLKLLAQFILQMTKNVNIT